MVELRGTSALYGWNNYIIYSSADEEFPQYFGFTRKEVLDFLDGDEKRIQDVMQWYNGYDMGSHQIVNPWSFMNYVDTGKLKSYGIQTSNMDSICAFIDPILSVDLIKIHGQFNGGNEY